MSDDGLGREFTVKELAKLMECHVETIRRAIKAKELPATRHPTRRGHPLIVRGKHAREWIDRRKALGR